MRHATQLVEVEAAEWIAATVLTATYVKSCGGIKLIRMCACQYGRCGHCVQGNHRKCATVSTWRGNPPASTLAYVQTSRGAALTPVWPAAGEPCRWRCPCPCGAEQDALEQPAASQGPRRVRVLGDLYHGRTPDGAVYVGRGAPGLTASPYANPHRVGACSACGDEHDQDDAVAAYSRDLDSRPELVATARRDLAGADLACWCRPDGRPCHADVLLRVVAGAAAVDAFAAVAGDELGGAVAAAGPGDLFAFLPPPRRTPPGQLRLF